MVGRSDSKIGLQRHDPRRQAREDDLELAPLALDLLLALASVLAGASEPLRHVVEGVHEETDLVARRRGYARGEVAARDGPRRLHEQLDRRDEAPREIERTVNRREQRDRSGERRVGKEGKS